MASSQPSHTTQTTKVELPKWVEQASESNYELARTLGEQKFQQYQGDRVANTSDLTKRAMDYGSDSLGWRNKNYRQADNIFDKLASFRYDPKDVKMGQLKNADIGAYMNPELNQVVDKSIADLNDQRIQALMGNSTAAEQAGAFGGSRHGIVDAVTNAESAKDAGLLSAQLRSQAFDNARQAALTDIQGKYTADLSNRDADIQKQLDRMTAMATGAGGKITANDARMAQRQQNFTNMFQSGLFSQQQRQRNLDSMREVFGESRNYDLENLNLRLSALGMSPYGKTETTDKTVEEGSSGADWITGGLGVFQLLMGLSEDKKKTDIEEVGKLPGTDLNLWAYRYKKDPKTYPKVVGLMASDIEKKIPEAVDTIGDTRVVNYQAVMKKIMEAA